MINSNNNLNGLNSISATTISATTFFGDGSNLTGISGGSTFTGGTVSGSTNFISGLSAETLTLNTTYTGTTGVGTISWNSNFGVPQVGMLGGNVVGKIGESVYAYVKNVDSTTLNKGEVVYIFGASGDKMSVKRASATGDTTSSKTLGVVAESIGVNGLGYIITQGTLDGLNLGSYTDGDILWLSTTAGQFTKVKSYAPVHLVFVGVVQRANSGNGQIYVKPQNGYELEELHNVATTGATQGDLLIYNSGTTLWQNSKTLNGNYTINGSISATTYFNLPTDIRVTGGTYSNGTATFRNNTGATFSVTGFSTATNFTGGTISGATNFTNGLTASTISATTYSNLPVQIGSFGITIDGGGSAITTGIKGYIEVPYSGTITSWTILADQSGSAVVDLWKTSYASAPATSADTITASARPTLSSAVKGQSSTLTGWTTAVAAGDIIAFNVVSASASTRITLALKITKS
jgi:hypothetical protein